MLNKPHPIISYWERSLLLAAGRGDLLVSYDPHPSGGGTTQRFVFSSGSPVEKSAVKTLEALGYVNVPNEGSYLEGEDRVSVTTRGTLILSPKPDGTSW